MLDSDLKSHDFWVFFSARRAVMLLKLHRHGTMRPIPPGPGFILDFFSVNIAGIGQFVQHFAEPGDPEYAPPVTKGETPVRVLIFRQ